MYAAGGPEFFNKATHYEEGIWDTPEAKTCFDIVNKLASYTNPITPAQANDQDFTPEPAAGAGQQGSVHAQRHLDRG